MIVPPYIDTNLLKLPVVSAVLEKLHSRRQAHWSSLCKRMSYKRGVHVGAPVKTDPEASPSRDRLNHKGPDPNPTAFPLVSMLV